MFNLTFKDVILTVDELFIESHLTGLLEGGYLSPTIPDYIDSAKEAFRINFSKSTRLNGELIPLIVNPDIVQTGTRIRDLGFKQITYYEFNEPLLRFTAFVTVTTILVSNTSLSKYNSYKGVIIWYQDVLTEVSELNKTKMKELLFEPYSLEFEY
jgi:hypothetical protein